MICCDKLTSSSPATSIHSIHSPIMTLLALEKGQLVSGWRHFRMKKTQSCEGKLNFNLTCAVDQLWLFIFRTNKRNKKKGKEKEAVTAHATLSHLCLQCKSCPMKIRADGSLIGIYVSLLEPDSE